MAETGELTEMLKALLEDRKTIEADFEKNAEFRLKKQPRSRETKYESRWTCYGDYSIEGAHGEGGGERRATSRDPKVAKLTDADDIEAYMVTFE